MNQKPDHLGISGPEFKLNWLFQMHTGGINHIIVSQSYHPDMVLKTSESQSISQNQNMLHTRFSHIIFMRECVTAIFTDLTKSLQIILFF